jgi:hypothetical protein
MPIAHVRAIEEKLKYGEYFTDIIEHIQIT